MTTSELRKEMIENGIHYNLVGDYYFPNFANPDDHGSFGKWADLHQTYLKEHQRGVYLQLLMSNRIIPYLERFNEQAEERYQRIIEQMKQAEEITEKLKAEDQMGWVHKMNIIIGQAEEMIRDELIHR